MIHKLNLLVRILYGLIFFVFGLNGFLNFMPTPSDIPEAALSFVKALASTGYMIQMVKGIEVLSGFLLLTGFFVPLALLLLSPIVVNIVLFHIFLAPGGELMTLVILTLQLYLAWVYRAAFKSCLKAKIKV